MSARDDRRDATHDQILASAGRLLRERGLAATSVAEVMKGAGLTVGGFYAHFASKDALLSEAVRRAAGAMRERLFAGLAGRDPGARFEAVVRRYLSRGHRDDPAAGCPLPAVVGEVASSATAQREALADAVEAMGEGLASQLQGAAPTAQARAFAFGLLALFYGGLTLSRAVRDTALSDEILRASREFARLARRGAEGATAGGAGDEKA